MFNSAIATVRDSGTIASNQPGSPSGDSQQPAIDPTPASFSGEFGAELGDEVAQN